MSFFYYNTVTHETLLYREDEMMLAASTIKVPVVMAWIDLIEQGVVSWDTKLVYQTSEPRILPSSTGGEMNWFS